MYAYLEFIQACLTKSAMPVNIVLLLYYGKCYQILKLFIFVILTMRVGEVEQIATAWMMYSNAVIAKAVEYFALFDTPMFFKVLVNCCVHVSTFSMHVLL